MTRSNHSGKRSRKKRIAVEQRTFRKSEKYDASMEIFQAADYYTSMRPLMLTSRDMAAIDIKISAERKICKKKRVYNNPDDALRAAAEDTLTYGAQMYVYWCPICSWMHLTRTAPKDGYDPQYIHPYKEEAPDSRGEGDAAAHSVSLPQQPAPLRVEPGVHVDDLPRLLVEQGAHTNGDEEVPNEEIMKPTYDQVMGQTKRMLKGRLDAVIFAAKTMRRDLDEEGLTQEFILQYAEDLHDTIHILDMALAQAAVMVGIGDTLAELDDGE